MTTKRLFTDDTALQIVEQLRIIGDNADLSDIDDIRTGAAAGLVAKQRNVEQDILISSLRTAVTGLSDALHVGAVSESEYPDLTYLIM